MDTHYLYITFDYLTYFIDVTYKCVRVNCRETHWSLQVTYPQKTSRYVLPVRF